MSIDKKFIEMQMAYEEKITELEAKLAEKDAELEKWSTQYARAYVVRQNDLIAENQQLKQQLEEKEKEISNLKGLINERDKQIKNLKTNKKRVIEHKNKVKISFAVEQLEKVKEKLLEELRNVIELLAPLEYEDYHKFIGCGRGYKNSIEEINNQILELKKEMK